jgi:two-component system LytT family response regulator
MKSILIDDEPRGISSLQRLLATHCPQVEIVDTCKRANEAIVSIEKNKPDLVFLDIAMPGKNAFEMLQEFQDIPFEIIFVTAYDQFTTQALHLSAVDYLLKPVEEDLLINAVKRAATRISYKTGIKPLETLIHNMQQPAVSQKMKLCIPSIRGFQVVKIQKIIYIEADSNYSNFHFTDRPLLCASKPLHEYADVLEDCNFARVHKSYVVNLNHITEYIKGEGGYVIMSNGAEVEVSRRKKEVLQEKMRMFFKY